MIRISCSPSKLLLAGFLGVILGALLRDDSLRLLPHAHAQEARATRHASPRVAAPTTDGKLRIIAFGAHPDDCEIQVGGAGALFAAQGHHVKFVSVTNGDIGHWREAGGPLALRRKAEVTKADAMLGVAAEVLDLHDGELLPTLENRRTITRLIREWKADIVLSPRSNDYHPDHRNTGLLLQDSAFMVTVPFFVPDVPYLRRNPVFLSYTDRFQKPNVSQADVVVDIGAVVEKKIDALSVMESQFLEGGANGGPELIPSDPAKLAARKQQVRDSFANRSRGVANRFRAQLVDWYGKERGDKVGYAEAFEVSEYGRVPTKDELRKLFAF